MDWVDFSFPWNRRYTDRDRTTAGNIRLTSENHSGRNAGLFKQEPSGKPGSNLSLSDYIARYLNGESLPEEALPAPRQETSPLLTWVFPSHSEAPSTALAGQRINSLDIEMGAGLEQYLPTPLFRFRVMKKRLNDEITELHERLNKYRRLTDVSPELQVRMNAIEERIGQLEAHEAQVSRELAELMSVSPLLSRLNQQSQDWREALNRIWQDFRHAIIRLVYGEAYETMEAGNAELLLLNELFAERLKDVQANSAELSQVLNRYEQTLHQLESARVRLKRP